VGIIPTDTLPALVCDPENRQAVVKLYAAKEMSAKKPLSMLCR
jgi:tRNA A37 threonylcarbamoyladenosine synthetase subunit TsaC/SUA5/YrdC